MVPLFTGHLSASHGLLPAFKALCSMPTIARGVLVVRTDQGEAELAISEQGLIIGAMIRGKNEQDLFALKKILDWKEGQYAFFEGDEYPSDHLRKVLRMDIISMVRGIEGPGMLAQQQQRVDISSVHNKAIQPPQPQAGQAAYQPQSQQSQSAPGSGYAQTQGASAAGGPVGMPLSAPAMPQAPVYSNPDSLGRPSAGYAQGGQQYASAQPQQQGYAQGPGPAQVYGQGPGVAQSQSMGSLQSSNQVQNRDLLGQNQGSGQGQATPEGTEHGQNQNYRSAQSLSQAARGLQQPPSTPSDAVSQAGGKSKKARKFASTNFAMDVFTETPVAPTPKSGEVVDDLLHNLSNLNRLGPATPAPRTGAVQNNSSMTNSGIMSPLPQPSGLAPAGAMMPPGMMPPSGMAPPAGMMPPAGQMSQSQSGPLPPSGYSAVPASQTSPIPSPHIVPQAPQYQAPSAPPPGRQPMHSAAAYPPQAAQPPVNQPPPTSPSPPGPVAPVISPVQSAKEKKSVTATLLEGNLVFVDELGPPDPVPVPTFSPGGPLNVPIIDDSDSMDLEFNRPSEYTNQDLQGMHSAQIVQSEQTSSNIQADQNVLMAQHQMAQNAQMAQRTSGSYATPDIYQGSYAENNLNDASQAVPPQSSQMSQTPYGVSQAGATVSGSNYDAVRSIDQLDPQGQNPESAAFSQAPSFGPEAVSKAGGQSPGSAILESMKRKQLSLSGDESVRSYGDQSPLPSSMGRPEPVPSILRAPAADPNSYNLSAVNSSSDDASEESSDYGDESYISSSLEAPGSGAVSMSRSGSFRSRIEEAASAVNPTQTPSPKRDLSRMRGGGQGKSSEKSGRPSAFEQHKTLFIIVGGILIVLLLVAGIIGALFAMHIIHT